MDELVTVGAWVLLVMAMVGWVGALMEVMVGMHAGQGGAHHMSGDAGAFSECKVNTLMTPDHTAFQVHNSGQGRAGISPSSGEGFIMGWHWKGQF